MFISKRIKELGEFIEKNPDKVFEKSCTYLIGGSEIWRVNILPFIPFFRFYKPSQTRLGNVFERYYIKSIIEKALENKNFNSIHIEVKK
jgi:hypothetical protein